jgi:oxalate decarboxylase/phosphoglucose isomerase-like protein (cupin superfamily)
MDFNANDVGFVPRVAGHYIENTGDSDLVFLEILAAPQFLDISLNNWLRRLPTEMVGIGCSPSTITTITNPSTARTLRTRRDRPVDWRVVTSGFVAT